jgi:ankyrin repeat protein
MQMPLRNLCLKNYNRCHMSDSLQKAILRVFTVVLSLVAFHVPAFGNVPPAETILSADVNAGHVKIFGEIKISTDAQIMDTPFASPLFGYVWRIVPGKTLVATFRIPEGVGRVIIKTREIGYPDTTEDAPLDLSVNGTPVEIQVPHPEKRKIRIVDITDKIREGDVNTLQLRTQHTTFGLQTLAIVYAVVPPVAQWETSDKTFVLTLLSPVKGQSISLEREVKISWIAQNMPEGAKVTIQYSDSPNRWNTIVSWIPYNYPTKTGNIGQLLWKPPSASQNLQFRILYNGVLNLTPSDMFTAIENGDYQKVKVMLEQKPDMAQLTLPDNEYGWNILHLAALKGQSEIVYILLQFVDVNARDNNGNTALHLASLKGHREVVELLLAEDAEINPMNHDGKTPLNLAIERGQKQIELLLREFGAVAVASGSLFAAIQQGDLGTVEKLLQWKPNLINEAINGLQPIHVAAKEGNNKLIEVLVAHGADLHAQDQNGFTPLHIAVLYHKYSTVRALLRQRADINAADAKQRTPLHLAVIEVHDDLVKLLLDQGAQVGMQDNEGRTPLELAELLHAQYLQEKKRLKIRQYEEMIELLRYGR